MTAPSKPPAPAAIVNPDLDPRTAAIQVLTDLQAIKAKLAAQDELLRRLGMAIERHRLELIRIKRDLNHGPLARPTGAAPPGPPSTGPLASGRPKPRSA